MVPCTMFFVEENLRFVCEFYLRVDNKKLSVGLDAGVESSKDNSRLSILLKDDYQNVFMYN